jgi:4-hydroxy-3-polyprenylbenzoate decarboxylase
MSQRIVVGITGGSGAAYARRLLEFLLRTDVDVHLIVSPLGQKVAAAELGTDAIIDSASAEETRLTRHPHDDLFSPLASGSYPTDGMIVCPCSCHTLAGIASGLAGNLILRAAHVHLKERRPLVLCIREMPLTRIDLRNMLEVAEGGAVVCPASPAFYGRPQSIDDLVDSVVGKLLDLLGVENDLMPRFIPPKDRADSTPDDHG